MRRNSLVLPLALLGACDGAEVGNRSARAGAVKVSDVSIDANGSAPVEGVGAPMAWRVQGGAASYGAASEPPIFALQCDRRAQQIVLERAGGGTALNLEAGGYGSSLGTRALASGRVQARAGLTDAVLERMARAQSVITVGGGEESFTVPGGVAVRRVIEACRRPEPAPVVALPQPSAGNIVVPETIDEPAPEPLPEAR